MRRYRYDDLSKHALARLVDVRLMAGMDTVKDQPHSDEQWE
jgi:hypothetical protein